MRRRLHQILAMLGFRVERWGTFEERNHRHQAFLQNLDRQIGQIAARQSLIEEHLGAAAGSSSVGREPDEFEKFINELEYISIESTNHCGYHCHMCPHDGIKRPKGFQSIEDLQWLLKNIRAYRPEYAGYFYLHGSGDPLLDKQLADKIALIRENLPDSNIRFYSTLGYDLPDGLFEKYILAGLNAIFVSFYGINRQSYEKVHGVDRFDTALANLVNAAALQGKYPSRFTVHVTGPFKVDDHAGHEAFKQKINDLGLSNYADGVIHNFAKMDFNALAMPVKPCSIYRGPLSRILQIDWDMKVIPCCLVMDQEVVFGDLREKPLREIFYDSPWTDFREAHQKMKLKEKYPFCWRCMHDTNEWNK